MDEGRDTKGAQARLRELGRDELAELLRPARFDFIREEVWFDVDVQALQVAVPQPYCEALESLPDYERKRIVEALVASVPKEERPRESVERVQFVERGEAIATSDALVPELILLREQMIDVAVGKKRIQDVDDYYRARHRRVRAVLAERGLEDPNQFADLWAWYRKWSAECSQYKERRAFVRSLYDGLLRTLCGGDKKLAEPREPTGWERVDRTVEKTANALLRARNEEDFQVVGHQCREVLISLAQAVYDPAAHETPDGVKPSATDAKRMFEAYINSVLPGESNEVARKYAKSGFDLANVLQHRRTATARDAGLCAEATFSVVNLIAILAGRRAPAPK